jgi:hypothetical protein
VVAHNIWLTRNKQSSLRENLQQEMYDAPKNCSARENEPKVEKEKTNRQGKKE